MCSEVRIAAAIRPDFGQAKRDVHPVDPGEAAANVKASVGRWQSRCHRIVDNRGEKRRQTAIGAQARQIGAENLSAGGPGDDGEEATTKLGVAEKRVLGRHRDDRDLNGTSGVFHERRAHGGGLQNETIGGDIDLTDHVGVCACIK